MGPITLTKQLQTSMAVADIYDRLRYLFSTPTALLETASISTKEHTNSLIMVSAAVAIRCHGEVVELESLNANGKQFCQYIKPFFKQVEDIGSKLRIFISHNRLRAEQDELRKLQTENVLDVLRVVLSHLKSNANDDLTSQLIGTFSFDFYQLYEQIPSVDGVAKFPDFEFFIADTLITFDHASHTKRIVSKVLPGNSTEVLKNDYQERLSRVEKQLENKVHESEPQRNLEGSSKLESMTDILSEQVNVNIDDAHFSKFVDRAKEHILSGDVFQMVLARDFTIACPDPFNAYLELRKANPSPYMFFVDAKEYQLFGASPESSVKYENNDRLLSIYPIAGTRRRGFDTTGALNADLDARIELELKCDEKERAEHLMLVDLARNDVARVCVSASRKIERLMEVDRYSHVLHLVSKVTGRLADDYDSLAAYQACMNMGTLSGAPKVRASQLIREIEQGYRGVYGGAMGYVNAAGDMDTAIVIRSALVKKGVATVSAGAGIVYDSQPKLEIKETENKAAAVLNAIKKANKKLCASPLDKESV